jgi:hypothetical protein
MYDSGGSAMPCPALPCHACTCLTAAETTVGLSSPTYKACYKEYQTKICLDTLSGHQVLASSQDRGHLCIKDFLWMNRLQFGL